MASPRPVPFENVPRNGWKIASSSSAGIPTPSSETSSTTESCDGSPPDSTRAPSVSRPPSRIARSPLVARFQTICRTWFSSASNATSAGGTRTSMTCPSSTSELLRNSTAASFSKRRTSRRAIENRCGFAYARNDRMVSFKRSDSRSTMSMSCACSSVSGSSCRRIWIDPDIAASGLRISWAMPAAISPTAASRCLSRASRSSFLMSVTS